MPKSKHVYSRCSGRPRKTLAEVRKAFERVGYFLLTKKYTNAHGTLDYVCANGHNRSTTWNRFQQGSRCPKCAGQEKLTFEDAKALFSAEGYTLVATEYKNVNTAMKYLCPFGHCGNINVNDFKGGHRCSECSGRRRKNIDFIRMGVQEYGYVLLSTKYTNNKTKLKLRCSNDHICYIKWCHFSAGVRCNKCNKLGVSKTSQEWLDISAVKVENREVVLWCGDRLLKVDGFCPETNTVYEFLGDFWHGNPNKFDQDEVHPVRKKTFGQLFDETIERLFLLRRNGYNLNVIWEEDFIL